jgi:hypothetical protein
MREFLTRITFARVLVLTVIGAVYIGMTVDLPSRRPPKQRPPVQTRIARANPRRLPAPPGEVRLKPMGVDRPGQSAVSLDVKPLSVWRGTLPVNHLSDGRPAGSVVTDVRTWRETWNRLRGEEPPPTIDFTREIVVLGTIPGANVAALKVWRDANGKTRLTIFGNSKPATRGGYILARFDRKKIDFSTMRKARHAPSKI